MLAPTHAESGCELYELYESDSSGRFYLNETWESRDCARSTPGNAPLSAPEENSARELVKEPFEVNIVKEVLVGAAAA